MVIRYAFYAYGFRLNLTLADFGLFFFIRLSFCFFSLLFFRLTFLFTG